MKLKTFLSENLDLIGKLIVYQIGMTIFGLAVTTAATAAFMQTVPNAPLYASLFSILFYLFLIYTGLWDFGAKDKIRAEAGRMKRDPFLGLKVALAANALNLFFRVLMLLGATAGQGNKLYAIPCIITGFTESYYTGTVHAILPGGEVNDAAGSVVVALAYLALILLPLAVSLLGYYAGLREWRVFRNRKNKEN